MRSGDLPESVDANVADTPRAAQNTCQKGDSVVTIAITGRDVSPRALRQMSGNQGEV